MSDLNDAKQLILETEIDNVIEESFLGSLNKVKFEVAAVLAGAAAILFKLPNRLSELVVDNYLKPHADKLINSINNNLEVDTDMLIGSINSEKSRILKMIEKAVDTVPGSINDTKQLYSGIMGDSTDDSFFAGPIKELNNEIRNGGGKLIEQLRDKLVEARDQFHKIPDYAQNRDMLQHNAATNADIADSHLIANADLIIKASQDTILVAIVIAVIMVIYKLWKYFKTEPTANKAIALRSISNFKSSLMKLKRIK